MASMVGKSSNHVLGVLSVGAKPTSYFMKLVYLCRFEVLVRRDKLYDQVPLKLMRQLQEQARRMKYSEVLQE